MADLKPMTRQELIDTIIEYKPPRRCVRMLKGFETEHLQRIYEVEEAYNSNPSAENFFEVMGLYDPEIRYCRDAFPKIFSADAYFAHSIGTSFPSDADVSRNVVLFFIMLVSFYMVLNSDPRLFGFSPVLSINARWIYAGIAPISLVWLVRNFIRMILEGGGSLSRKVLHNIFCRMFKRELRKRRLKHNIEQLIDLFFLTCC